MRGGVSVSAPGLRQRKGKREDMGKTVAKDKVEEAEEEAAAEEGEEEEGDRLACAYACLL